MKRDQLDFEWLHSNKSPLPEKTNFCLNTIILNYFNKVSDFKETKQKAKDVIEFLAKINAIFGKVMKDIPFFKYYFSQDFALLSELEAPSNTENEHYILQSSLDGTPSSGGETLLMALYYCTKMELPSSYHFSLIKLRSFAFNYFSRALEKNVTIASYMAVKTLKPYNHEKLFQLCKKSADMGDFRGLETLLLLHPAYAATLSQEGFDYPPILAQLAHNQSEHDQAAELFDKALSGYRKASTEQVSQIGYRNIAPAWVLAQAASRHLKLNDCQKAARLFDEAISKYSDDVPAWVLTEAAYAHLGLKNYPEAMKLYNEAISKYGEDVPALVLADAAYAHLESKNYPEAARLYDKAILKYDHDVTAHVLANAAYAHFESKNYPEAARLSNEAISKYGDDVTAHVLANAAFAHLESKNYPEAAKLFDKAISKSGDDPANVLTAAAFVYLELKNYPEAARLSNEAISKYGDDVPAWVLSNAAGAHLSLKNFPEAAKLYDKAILKYGDVPARVLSNAAKVHLELKDYTKAAELYGKAIIKFGESVPEEVLKSAEKARTLAL